MPAKKPISLNRMHMTKAQKQAIGESLLEGLDATKETDALTRDKAKLDGLTEALTQAKTRLTDTPESMADHIHETKGQ